MASNNNINIGDLGMYVAPPRSCLEKLPTTQSVLFCEEYIKLTDISLRTGISVSSLSMIFSRTRRPSLKGAMKIADALTMDLVGFLKGLGIH
jgi:transcriptional regulator with XRE-family HTH domain